VAEPTIPDEAVEAAARALAAYEGYDLDDPELWGAARDSRRGAMEILAAAYPLLAQQIRAEVLHELVGAEDEPGQLDQIFVLAQRTEAGADLVWWHCRRDCGEGGVGTLGIIARDLDGDQTNLTLGELVEAALTHEVEEHAGTETIDAH
jgi:hypothetical protein